MITLFDPDPRQDARLLTTSKGPLVLLFYNGFDRKAVPGYVGAVSLASA